MAPGAAFEQITHQRLLALSVVDTLAQSLRVNGAFPAPLGPLAYELTAALPPAAAVYVPPLPLWSRRNASGYWLLDGSFSDPDDPEQRRPLADGKYTVRTHSDYYQDASFTLTWPPTAQQTRVLDAANQPLNVSLLPGAAYPLPNTTMSGLQLGPTILRGGTLTSAGDPLAGILVEVVNLALIQPPELPPLVNWQPFLQPLSDDRGGWAIVLPGRRFFDATSEVPPAGTVLPLHRQFTIRTHYPTGQIDRVEDVVLGSDYAVRNTALRGQVVGPRARPIAGARITSSAGAASSVSRSDGSWFLYFMPDQVTVPNVTVTATLPDGTALSDTTATLLPKMTVVVPTFNFP
jgi:hypothetical protein